MTKRINSKQKGNRWERECARFLQRWWPEARRQTYDQSRRGNEQPDVMGTPFWVECKNYKHITNGMKRKWTDKMLADSKGVRSLLMMRDNSTKTSFAILSKSNCASMEVTFDVLEHLFNSEYPIARLVESEGI